MGSHQGCHVVLNLLGSDDATGFDLQLAGNGVFENRFASLDLDTDHRFVEEVVDRQVLVGQVQSFRGELAAGLRAGSGLFFGILEQIARGSRIRSTARF